MGKMKETKDKAFQGAVETQSDGVPFSVSDLAEERNMALAADEASDFAAEAARAAAAAGYEVEELHEVSSLYSDEMGGVLFKVEGSLRVQASKENGIFVGRLIRVISQTRSDDIPHSLFVPLEKGQQLMLAVGNVDSAGNQEIGRFREIAEAPEGTVFYLKNAPYVPAERAFKRLPIGGGRTFAPRPWARAKLRGT